MTAKRARILAVDDDSDLLALMAKALGAAYDVDTAPDAGMAIEKAFASPQPDLILCDVEMPDVSGFEVCRALKGEAATAHIPIIFLTSKLEAEAQVEGFDAGAVDYVAKPINAKVLKARVRLHLALIDRRQELESLVQERTAQLERTRAELIRRLARAMELHESAAVGNRVVRLGHYARLIAQAAGAKPQVAEMMMLAAPLHDVGKLGVPSEILRKREKLSAPDWERVKRHPQLGADIIGEHDDPLLKLARQLALTHHEHWDGSGYPQGLKGEAIPWSGRVMAVVDAFESMTTTQFYRDPRSPQEAAREILQGAGTKYDPAIVEAFKKAAPVMQKVRDTYADSLGDMVNLDFAPIAGAAAKPAAASPPKKPAVDVAALARAAARKAAKYQ
ncbi:MAG: response regulator [Betaproteobacteria bacterium]|nr:MAG: response regulator [Betaproteobacteria bacterium]TMH41982.1 MAG: response regulator [Betaproteobacteria bacterium]